MAVSGRIVRIAQVPRFTAAIFVLLFASVSSANAPDVYWSGFAYEGQLSAASDRYPYSKRLADRGDAGELSLDDRLRQSIAGVHNDSFNIVFGELGSIGADAASSIALALVLDRETVSVEEIGGHHKILVAISAQALFFDFREMATISTFPMSTAYIHVTKANPTEDQLATLVEDLYFGSLEANVFNEFASALAKAELNTSVSRRIQVTDVSVDPDVLAKLPDYWQDNPDDFGAFLAQQFGRSLSTNQQVPVLPFTKGYAIGNRMSASFAEGEVYSLTLPEPDFIISLRLEKLVKLEYAEVAAGTSYIYGSYLIVRAEEPLSGRVYLDTTIKNGAIKKVPASQPYVDDWPAYQDSIFGLVDKFTREISAPTKKWVKKHAGDAGVRDQLSSFGKVVLSCR